MKNRKITEKRLKEFKAELINDEKSELTVEKYMRDVRHFAEYVNGQQIDKTLVLAYKAQLEKEYAVASANSMLASINAFFRFEGWLELCVKQFKVQKQTFCNDEKELTKAEYTRLCEAAEKSNNERLNLIIQTICGTGIRVSELQFITVEALAKGEAKVSCKNKTRTVFIISELRVKLIRYCRENNITRGQIFVTKSVEMAPQNWLASANTRLMNAPLKDERFLGASLVPPMQVFPWNRNG